MSSRRLDRPSSPSAFAYWCIDSSPPSPAHSRVFLVLSHTRTAVFWEIRMVWMTETMEILYLISLYIVSPPELCLAHPSRWFLLVEPPLSIVPRSPFHIASLIRTWSLTVIPAYPRRSIPDRRALKARWWIRRCSTSASIGRWSVIRWLPAQRWCEWGLRFVPLQEG